MRNITVETEIPVECDVCGDDVECQQKWKGGQYVLYIKPCTYCLGTATDEGYEKGKEESGE